MAASHVTELPPQEVPTVTYEPTAALPDKLLTISDRDIKDGDIILVPLVDHSPDVDDAFFKKFTVDPATSPVYHGYLMKQYVGPATNIMCARILDKGAAVPDKPWTMIKTDHVDACVVDVGYPAFHELVSKYLDSVGSTYNNGEIAIATFTVDGYHAYLARREADEEGAAFPRMSKGIHYTPVEAVIPKELKRQEALRLVDGKPYIMIDSISYCRIKRTLKLTDNYPVHVLAIGSHRYADLIRAKLPAAIAAVQSEPTGLTADHVLRTSSEA